MSYADDTLCEVCRLPLSDHTLAMAEDCTSKLEEDEEERRG